MVAGIRILQRWRIPPIRSWNSSWIFKDRTEKSMTGEGLMQEKGKRWAKAKWRVTWLVRVRGRKHSDWYKKCAVASVKSEIEVMGSMMTLVSQEVQEIFFSVLFSSREYIVSWERILSEHLRKEFYPVLFTPILAQILEEWDRKRMCLIHL